MKTKDKEFIREIVSSGFKPISNSDFTSDTLGKIAELEDYKISYSYSGDIFFLIPVIIYVSMFFLFSLITVFISWTQLEQIDNILHSVEMISIYFLHPFTFSILFSFSLLYLFDLFLKKLYEKITKPDNVYSSLMG
jgi:hypothetical protein